MMTTQIRMHFMQPNGFEMLCTKAFTVEPKGRWSWLQRICWKFLQKTHATHPHFDKNQLVTSVAIDPEKAVSVIVREAAHQLRMAGSKPVRILLGSEDFARLMDDPSQDLARSGYLSFSPIDYGVRTGPELYGLKIEVIPHMSGVLVV